MSPALKLASEDFWSVGCWIQICKQTLAIKRAWTRARSICPLYVSWNILWMQKCSLVALHSMLSQPLILEPAQQHFYEVFKHGGMKRQGSRDIKVKLDLDLEQKGAGQPMVDQNLTCLCNCVATLTGTLKYSVSFANCWRIVSLGPEHVNWDQLGTPLSRKLSMAEWPNMALRHGSSMFPMSSFSQKYFSVEVLPGHARKEIVQMYIIISLVGISSHWACGCYYSTTYHEVSLFVPCRHIQLTSHANNVTSCLIMSQNQGPPSGSKPGQQPRASGNDVLCQQKLECPIPASMDRGPNRPQLRCERNTSLWNGSSNAFKLAWVHPAKPLFLQHVSWITELQTARESDLWCHAVATSAIESCNQLLHEWMICNRKKTLPLLAGNCELWPGRITADRT